MFAFERRVSQSRAPISRSANHQTTRVPKPGALHKLMAMGQLSRPDDAAEREASMLGDRVAAGAVVAPSVAISSGQVSRMCMPCAEHGEDCTTCDEGEDPDIASVEGLTSVDSESPVDGESPIPMIEESVDEDEAVEPQVEEDAEPLVHRSARGRSTPELPDEGLVPSGGAPLPEDRRVYFEGRLGADLSEVRVHTGNEAARAADAIDARAFTIGKDIVFNAGEYEQDRSNRLLAHELVHVLQQPDRPRAPSAVAPVDHPTEHEAERLSLAATSTTERGVVEPVSARSSGAVNRQKKKAKAKKAKPKAYWKPPSGKWILVWLPRRAIAYEGSKKIRMYTISGGKPGHRTPNGRFRIHQRDKDHTSSKYGKCVWLDKKQKTHWRRVKGGAAACKKGEKYQGADMAYYQKFAPMIGFHRGSPNVPSHGCIHVGSGEVQTMWKWSRLGTPVIVCTNCDKYTEGILHYRAQAAAAAAAKKKKKKK